MAAIQHYGAAFCLEVLKNAPVKHGMSEILHADEGSQFTSGDWIGVLFGAKIGEGPDQYIFETLMDVQSHAA